MSIEILRDQVRDAVHWSSLRRVAREVGISHGGLSKFLEGSAPQPRTYRKLRDWQLRHALEAGSITAEVARTALIVLVEGIPEAERPTAIAELLEAARDVYRRRKLPIPSWLAAVQP